jgi:hypothetical protein
MSKLMSRFNFPGRKSISSFYVPVFLSVTAVVFSFSPLTHAAIDLDKPLSAGVALSRNHVSLPVGKSVSGDQISYFSANDTDIAWKIFLTMDYDQHLDLTLAYHDMGSYQHRIRSIFADKQLEAIINTQLQYKALSIDVRPKYTLGEKFVVQAIGGLAYVQGERNPSVRVIGGQNPDDLEKLENDLNDSFKTEKENKISLLYGLGFSWQWKENYALGFELNYSKHGSQDISQQHFSITRKIR